MSFGIPCVFYKKPGRSKVGKVELSQRAGLRSRSPKLPGFKLPTLRFRGKIMLGFAVVLAISAASMGFAYLGFDGVSSGVAAYRNSVAEADLERDVRFSVRTSRVRWRRGRTFCFLMSQPPGSIVPGRISSFNFWPI